MSERYTPSSWMRHVISWRVLGWLDRRLDTCWAGMVMWKEGYDWSWWPTDSCSDPHDYCGKFGKEAKHR